MVSKPLLRLLIICFWASIAFIAFQITVSFSTFFQAYAAGTIPEPSILIRGLYGILSIPWILLFCYTLYFFYKYDRYRKSGIYFLFFHLAYSLVYFYRVIWKQKRGLVGTYNGEAVLGNTVLLETEEEERDFEEGEDN